MPSGSEFSKMSEDETDKVKIRATESFENDKQNIPWLNEELAGPILQPLGDSDNQLTSEKHKDKKPTKGILSSVSEFSIADAPSKDTKSEKKLSDSSSASLSSLEKCRTQFTYIENDASVHQRDRDDITILPVKTTPTMIAAVTVILIAAFLNRAMKPVNVWNLPWRFPKSVTANRKQLREFP
ncbi:myoD family inhibitor domain-containing protein 2 isoform X3 [Pelodiscus sinensis]|uniref:myoD family inhibitor domain-containing protein 2 isoform X3 n=1 Tax=Pelodiscus sinensis TaxID=13735 RepID=UPI003F6C7D33